MKFWINKISEISENFSSHDLNRDVLYYISHEINQWCWGCYLTAERLLFIKNCDYRLAQVDTLSKDPRCSCVSPIHSPRSQSIVRQRSHSRVSEASHAWMILSGVCMHTHSRGWFIMRAGTRKYAVIRCEKAHIIGFRSLSSLFPFPPFPILLHISYYIPPKGLQRRNVTSHGALWICNCVGVPSNPRAICDLPDA